MFQSDYKGPPNNIWRVINDFILIYLYNITRIGDHVAQRPLIPSLVLQFQDLRGRGGISYGPIR